MPSRPPERNFSREYFPGLDGIRAASILWVLVCHLPFDLGPFLNPVRARGGLGVELFFCVSGLMVMRSLEQSRRESPGRLEMARSFLVKRCSRIWPAYFLMLGLVAFTAVVLPGARARLAQIGPIL